MDDPVLQIFEESIEIKLLSRQQMSSLKQIHLNSIPGFKYLSLLEFV